MNSSRSNAAFSILGGLLILLGLSVFAIRLIHAGPYAMPHGGALYGGFGLMVLGALLIWDRFRSLSWIALVISPLAMFPSIYSLMGESEEVISLYAMDADNQPVDLRLWIVDREDGAWVGMSRDKAVEHNLDGAQLSMLRSGEQTCVVPVLHEDQPTVRTIHAMKVEKYKVAQIAGAAGLYPLEATETTVALRLAPCSNQSEVTSE